MANDNDIVVRSDRNGGKVHLSADRVYDLNEDKTQDVINDEIKDITGNGQLSGFTATDLTGAANELKTTLNTLETAVDGKVSKSGDTMTGTLRVKTALSPTIPSADQYISCFTGDDSRGGVVGVFQIAHETSGIESVALQVQRFINGTFYANQLRLGLNGSGQRTLSLDSGLWRSTLSVSQIKKVTKSITTDQYGQIALPSPATSSNLINVYSDDYRYFVVKQSGTNVRAYNAGTSNITVAANTTLNVVIVYTEA